MLDLICGGIIEEEVVVVCGEIDIIGLFYFVGDFVCDVVDED